MEVKPVPFEVQPLFYRNKSDLYCEVSFDGKKFYTFKKSNIDPPWWIKKFDYIILHSDNTMIRCDGYYDKGLKILSFFYNQKINKTYKRIVKRQELEHSKQTFLIPDEEIRRKEKMSMKDIEDRKSGRLDLDDAPKYIFPDEINAEWKMRANQKGKEENCLYVNLNWEHKGKMAFITQMYTPWHLVQLSKRMKLMKIKDVTKWTKPHGWKLEGEPFGGTGNPRYLPVQDVAEAKAE
jgi:hypothetical protein